MDSICRRADSIFNIKGNLAKKEPLIDWERLFFCVYSFI